MSRRGRLGILVACLAIGAVIILGVVFSSGSNDSTGKMIRIGKSTVKIFTGSGVVCGIVGPEPTRADVEQFAAHSNFNAEQTRQLLACYGFPASG